jgi:hypothetical protein
MVLMRLGPSLDCDTRYWQWPDKVKPFGGSRAEPG